jgi:hypothetical protein
MRWAPARPPLAAAAAAERTGDCNGWVLVTGDPPANSHALTDAIKNLAEVMK